jgi:membrane-associated HD superfamily phosphohydrolase
MLPFFLKRSVYMSTVSTKQDRTYARTAQDLERKYSFGETFADMLGLINDNRDRVDSVESSLHDEIIEQSTTLQRDAQQIVMQAEQRLSGSIKDVSDDISDIYNKVNMQLDAEKVSIIVEEEISKGVERVKTTSGYVFDEKGLTISQENNEISNQLTHKGMYVKRNNDNILTADANGVKATDLHATTYLIVGKKEGRSRFEDYDVNGIKRTACFWVGG